MAAGHQALDQPGSQPASHPAHQPPPLTLVHPRPSQTPSPCPSPEGPSPLPSLAPRRSRVPPGQHSSTLCLAGCLSLRPRLQAGGGQKAGGGETYGQIVSGESGRWHEWSYCVASKLSGWWWKWQTKVAGRAAGAYVCLQAKEVAPQGRPCTPRHHACISHWGPATAVLPAATQPCNLATGPTSKPANKPASKPANEPANKQASKPASKHSQASTHRRSAHLDSPCQELRVSPSLSCHIA